MKNASFYTKAGLEEKTRLLRLFALVLVIDMLQNSINPVVWILGESQSIIGTVARLSSSPEVMAGCWLAMAALMLPYAWVTLAGRESTLCTRLIILALAGSGALWAYLAWLARDLDYSSTVWIFGGNAAISVGVSYIFARTINERQLTDEKTGATHEA